MATWLCVLSIFLALSLGYFAGFMAGSWKSDSAPSSNAWQNVRFHATDANKEVALYQIDKDHEEEMALIERGTYDNIPFSDPDDLHTDEDEPDGD